jgi:hypothetical protein
VCEKEQRLIGRSGPPPYLESNRILGVSTAQWRQVDLQAQLQMTRLDAEGADRCCFGIEQSIFAAPHTPNFRLLSEFVLEKQGCWAAKNDYRA